ncbi:MAG TPA: hypothetical protein VGA16_08985 [Candidatus Limnocylindria bacterium]
MLDLLVTVAGSISLAFYLAVAVVLPSGIVFLFVNLIGTLLRLAIDPVVAAIPESVRAGPLAPFGRFIRGATTRGIGIVLFLALVGLSTSGISDAVVQDGFLQLLITFTAIQDIVATWMTGRVLNDLLVQVQPARTESAVASFSLLQIQVTNHLFDTFKPGVTNLAFRWTLAAFEVGVVAVYVVFEPLRAARRRLASVIAPAQRETVISEESLERQAELIAQALAKATPAAAAPVAPAAPRVQWGRPGLARAPAAPLTPTAPTAIPSLRVAVVTWDGELAAEMERQLDAAGFSPVVLRSVAEAFASRVWPQIVFIDARHLQWLSPDRLPLLVRARLLAVTRDEVRVPRGWQLDTHAVESGADALLELLRRRDARRKGSAREGGA